MKLTVEARLRRAARGVFVIGAVMNAGIVLADDAAQLQGVEVTGSRIRRVEAQTSNPVFTLDRKSIEATGATSLGELLQSIPLVTGATLSPQVNNGSNDSPGESNVSLRGLGANRTLLLLDGQRVVTQDVNAIPINMIERVEVLKQGASAVYGSDAIAGVVNFITRKNFKGFEFTTQYGRAGAGDGAGYSDTLTYGTSGPEGSVVFGLGYNRQDEVAASDRDLTKDAFGIYYGQVNPFVFRSSRIPTGVYIVPGFIDPATGAGCGSTNRVTRIAGTTGNAPSDFRCADLSAGPSSDRFNFQTQNLALVPQKRLNFFGEANYKLSDDVRAYGSAFFTNTRSRNQLASEAFDLAAISAFYSPAINISANSIYNPFGKQIDSFQIRTVENGARSTETDANTYQGTFGLKGTVLERFDWDAAYTYGRISAQSTTRGYINTSQLQNQLGPSYYDPTTGAPTCGVEGSYVIPGCTPINFIGTNGDRYNTLSPVLHDLNVIAQNTFLASISGDLFSLPAGAVGASIGFQYQAQSLDNQRDQLEENFQLSESNQKGTKGSFNAREGFAEVNIPLLKDLPGIKSLIVNAGVRYENYSNIGGKANGKYGVEYRPIKDLLVRATYADVFRAPTISDLFAGGAQDAPSIIDPCDGINEPVGTNANHDAACSGVPRDGSYALSNTQGTGLLGVGNPNLKPETGFTTDFGFVYSPSFYKPLTVEVDYYKYSIDKAIGSISAQQVLDSCYTTGTFCNFVGNRDISTFEPSLIFEPTANVGQFLVQGVDFGLRLNYDKTPLGKFLFGFDGSYLQKNVQTTVDPSTGAILARNSVAGRGFPNGVPPDFYPRLKMTTFVSWDYGPFNIFIRDRFVSSISDDGGDNGLGTTFGVDAAADPAVCSTGAKGGDYGTPDSAFLCKRNIGYQSYVDVAATYKLKPLHTDFTVGVNDLFSDGAQAYYSSGPSFAYDNSNGSILGRFYYARMKISFN